MVSDGGDICPRIPDEFESSSQYRVGPVFIKKLNARPKDEYTIHTDTFDFRFSEFQLLLLFVICL